MTKLDELIAKRNELDKEIERLREASEEYAPTVISESPRIPLVIMEVNGQELVIPRDSGGGPVSVNIEIDNSVTNITNHKSRSEVNTTLTVGDSAISMLGNLLGSIFD